MEKRAHTTSGPIPTDFRLFLQAELVRRCQNNPRYSLRAFARTLRVSPSALSAMINGKRTITATSKRRFALALGISPEDLLRFESSSNGDVLRREYREFQQLTLDSYAVISDWYHYAILELIRIKDFKPDSAWVAKVLGLSKSEVNIAIERLQRVGLLHVTPKGTWVDTSANGNATNISGDLTSAASRKLQKQILELSIRAIEELPVELRNHTSMTLALNPKDLPVAREKIKLFRRELTQTLEENPEPTQVYQISISLFPVTQIKNGEKR